MATFNTHYDDQVGIDVHRAPLDEVKRLGHLGKQGSLTTIHMKVNV